MIFARPEADSGDAGGAGARPVLIGLTGPIGCGKSTVAGMLADVGGTIVDADVLAREATQPGSDALPLIRARFGDSVFNADASLNRAALAEVVFSDPAALADLESIVHPRVRVLVEQRLAAVAADGAPFVVVEAIKLIEGGLADRCDEVWLIECGPATQRTRLAGRGASPQDIERRTAVQGSDLVTRQAAALAEKGTPSRRLATDGSLDETRELVEELLADLLDRRR